MPLQVEVIKISNLQIVYKHKDTAIALQIAYRNTGGHFSNTIEQIEMIMNIDFHEEKQELERAYHYWISQIPGFGARKIAALKKYMGEIGAVAVCDAQSLQEAMEQINQEESAERGKNLFRKADMEKLLEGKETIEQSLEAFHKLKEDGIRMVIPEDSGYPGRLKELYDVPQLLYYYGRLPEDHIPAVSIVGARNCTHYGEEMAFVLAEALCSRGVNVISGMAMGIDGMAHRGALQAITKFRNSGMGAAGETYAVLGCGIDICYPRNNTDIYRALRGINDGNFVSGGILSEYAPGTQPAAQHFPMRNRIISGLADMVIVVEARFRSGSLITADLALEQGRDIFAVPGRITDPLSRGCNELVRQGAGIITDPLEFVEKYFPAPEKSMCSDRKIKLGLALPEEKVYSCLDFNSTHLGLIAERTGMAVQEVMVILMKLTALGLITETSKNYYALKFR